MWPCSTGRGTCLYRSLEQGGPEGDKLVVQACRKALLKAGCLPELLKQARRNLALAIEAVSSGGPSYSPEVPNAGYVLDYQEHHTSAYLEALLGVLERLTADEAASAGFVAPEVRSPGCPRVPVP